MYRKYANYSISTSTLPADLIQSKLDPLVYLYEPSTKPKSLFSTPYDNIINAIDEPVAHMNVNINTLSSISYGNYKIPMKLHTIQDNLLHISNYQASQQELDKAAEMADDKELKPVNLEYIKNISKTLHTKMTDLIYEQHRSLFATHQSQRKIIPNYEFKIDLLDSAPPRIFIPQYPLSESQRLTVIKQTQQNIKSGLFIPNRTSVHNVPMIVISKKGGRQRLAYALQLLNKWTKSIPSYIPTYQYIFEKIRGRGLYSVTDLKNFFECIKLRKSDQHLVHVTTPLGEYNLTAGTYGYKNISAMAQDISNSIVRPFPNAVAFVDDIVMKHAPDASHQQLYDDISSLLQRMSDVGVLCNPEKTWFFVEEIEYLGYIFNQLGTMPRPEYIQKVIDFKTPTKAKDVKSFLAVINYISRYVYKFAELAREINILTHQSVKWNWTEAHTKIFNQIKERVKNVKILTHPTPDGPFLVQTDASRYAISGVLYQKQYNHELKQYRWELIEFYSKSLDKHLIDKPIQVKECLAVTHALNHWKHFLLRKLFYVDTDHKNLVYLYDSDEMKASGMKKKQLFITMRYAIAQFHFKIAHIAGSKIPFADYLSRDGNSNYRKMNINLIQPKFNNKHRHASEIQYINTINYMQYIRDNNVNYPPSINHFQSDKFDQACYDACQDSINYLDTVKRHIVEKSIKQEKHKYEDVNMHHRWLAQDKINLTKDQINHIKSDTASNTYINIINSNIPQKSQFITLDCPSDSAAIDNLNILETLQHINEPTESINVLQRKRKAKKAVSFDLRTQTQTKLKDYKPELKPLKSPLKSSRKSKLNRKLPYSLIELIRNYKINNLRNVDKHINNELDKALYNRLRLQTFNLKARSVEQINQIYNEFINELDENNPNYNTDNKGRRTGTRIRKKPKSFYDTYREEQDQLKQKRQQKKGNKSKSVEPQQPSSQGEIHSKESKFHLTPGKADEIFKSLFSDLFYFRRLDSLLSPVKLRIAQLNDPIASTIIDYVTGKIGLRSRPISNLYLYYRKIFNLLVTNQFYISENNLLYLKKNGKYPHNRIVIPIELIPIALTYIHKSEHFNHPGITQTRKIIESKFFWYGYSSDVTKFVSECDECQLGKGHKHHRYGKLQPLTTQHHNQCVHLDFLGPIHKSLSILVMVDNYTGYTMLVPTHGQTTLDVIRALWNVWRPIHGLPHQLITDRGKGFISALNMKLYDIFGIRKLFTSSYHPETNAKAERVVQEVKKAYRMINVSLNGEITDNKNIKEVVNEIKMLLPSIQFSINQKLKIFSPVSPNMLLFGKQLNDTIDCHNTMKDLNHLLRTKQHQAAYNIIKQLNKSLKIIQSMHDHNYKKYVYIMKKNYDKTKLDRTLQIGDKVMYYVGDRAHTNKKLRPRYTGPFTVRKIISKNAVQLLNDETHETMVCHVKMLKLYHKQYFTPENQYRLTLKHKQRLDKISKQTELYQPQQQREQRNINKKKMKKSSKQRHQQQHHKSEDDLDYESVRENLFDSS